jgi:hypothetical protein
MLCIICLFLINVLLVLMSVLIPDLVLLFSIEEFIPLLRERMNVLNPYVRQFLVGWITVLDSVPDIDMLGFLPDFLDGNPSLFFKCTTLLLTSQHLLYHYPCRFVQYAE